MKAVYLCLLIFIVSACTKHARELPFYNTPDFEPKWSMNGDLNFHQIRPFNLIDQAGNGFTEKNIIGKVCIVDFFFTSCPGICPRMTESMSALQLEFKNNGNVLLLSHSVTPQKDSVQVLKQYAIDKQVNYNKWKLLTGSRNEIYELGRKYYFVEEDEGVARDESVFLHTENFILIDEDRHIRGIYNGLDPSSMQRLIEDVKVLLE
jgi:protein SCO1